MPAHPDLTALFRAAMTGDSAAACAFTDRLIELWPDVLAEWDAAMREEWRLYEERLREWQAATDHTWGPPFEPDLPALYVETEYGPGGDRGWRWLAIDGPGEIETDPGEWETVIGVTGEWYDHYAGAHTPGSLTLPPPDRWGAREPAALVAYLGELAGLPGAIEEAADP